MLRLDPTWRPQRDSASGGLLPQGRLWDFIERIAGSRREGKNRRDGATVSVRVLGLTDVLGGRLFEEGGSVGVERVEEGKGKGKRGRKGRANL